MERGWKPRNRRLNFFLENHWKVISRFIEINKSQEKLRKFKKNIGGIDVVEHHHNFRRCWSWKKIIRTRKKAKVVYLVGVILLQCFQWIRWIWSKRHVSLASSIRGCLASAFSQSWKEACALISSASFLFLLRSPFIRLFASSQTTLFAIFSSFCSHEFEASAHGPKDVFFAQTEVDP